MHKSVKGDRQVRWGGVKFRVWENFPRIRPPHPPTPQPPPPPPHLSPSTDLCMKNAQNISENDRTRLQYHKTMSATPNNRGIDRDQPPPPGIFFFAGYGILRAQIREATHVGGPTDLGPIFDEIGEKMLAACWRRVGDT